MDEREFEVFFREMHPALLRYGRRRLDVDTANDVAIEALRTIWMKKLSYPRNTAEEARLQGFAYKILDGLIRNQRRSEARRRDLVDAVGSELRTRKSFEPDTADIYENASGGRSLLSCLNKSDREILTLLADGYQVQEIATILNCTPKAASMRLSRARDRLRYNLERRGDVSHPALKRK
nr:RNA polymerase sigma factor [Actinomycetales bacterium]